MMDDGRTHRYTGVPHDDSGDAGMAKKARKKKARKNSKANHGKRPNS